MSPKRLPLFAAMFAMVPAVPQAAPVPKAKPILYFPTAKGTKWTYEISDTVKSTNAVEDREILESECRDSEWKVTVGFGSKGKPCKPVTGYVVSEKGVYQTSLGDWVFRKPLPSILLPAKKGDAWIAELQPMVLKDIRITDIERIKVRAGEFDTFKIESIQRNVDNDPIVTWWAPGMGIVKMMDGSAIYEMTQFTLPK